MRKVGRVGGKALIYFEAVSSVAEARALTNMIGNGIASMVVPVWENELDRNALHWELQFTKPRIRWPRDVV